MIVSSTLKKSIYDYKSVAGERAIEEIMSIAEGVKGVSVVHVNSTSSGGGVAEILHSIVPLMNSVGVRATWEVIEAPHEFFNVTKKIHNALQGAEKPLTEEEKSLYLEVNRVNAIEKLRLDADVAVVHDPQPLAIRRFYSGGRVKKWIWRCHIDLSSPYEPVWSFIKELLSSYDASIYHMREFIHTDTPTPRKYVVQPSIDPLNDKNRELKWSTIERVLSRYDVDPERPIIVQVGRFDPWKDPLGAIDVYRLVKKSVPGVQLLLIASMASDDPEGWVYFEKAVRRAGEDYDIHFLTNLVGVGPLEVNAFQRAATVVIQMSTREGFGLSVTEALWKRKPVVARPSGGIRLQVIDGYNGYLVEDIESAAKHVIHLIKNREERERMGENGRRLVREKYLITRHLRDYLRIIREVYTG